MVQASYQGIEVDLPPLITRRWFKWDRESYDVKNQCVRHFRNLAVSYADSTKNMMALEHAREWLALAKSDGERADVLGILWAKLHGMTITDVRNQN